MMGTVAGHPKKIVTNVSVQMSHDFSKIMQQLLKEANEGRFATKSEAVKRRDHLVEQSPAAPADPAAPAGSAEPAYSPAFTDSAVPADEAPPTDSVPCAPTDVDPDTAVVQDDPAEDDPADPELYPDRQPLDDSTDIW